MSDTNVVRQIQQRVRKSYLSFLARFMKERYKRKGPFSHMREADPLFKLCPNPNKPGANRVMWGGKHLMTTIPLQEAHNIQQGSCFIVGTGPSVADVDFSLLKDKFCFGVNGAIMKFKEAGFAPSAYTVTTSNFFKIRQHHLKDILSSGARCFFPFGGISDMAQDIPEYLTTANIHLADAVGRAYLKPKLSNRELKAEVKREAALSRHVRRLTTSLGFSRDLELGYFHGDNVIFTSLQVAYYMGFRRMFILGMDLNYSGARPRFYETKETAAPSWLDKTYTRTILPSFELIHSLCATGEFEVYNLSANSRLPQALIPKITLEEALALQETVISAPVKHTVVEGRA